LFDLEPALAFSPAAQGPRRGLERFRHMLHLPTSAALVTLGEGGTPLVGVKIHGRDIFFKCEHLNPTGSFKDRGTTVLVSHLAAAGITEAVEDSSGNAGSSFAAYAARAGISARVFTRFAAAPSADRRRVEFDYRAADGGGRYVLRAAASGQSTYRLSSSKPAGDLAYEIVEHQSPAGRSSSW
jgi:hypothetical protein